MAGLDYTSRSLQLLIEFFLYTSTGVQRFLNDCQEEEKMISGLNNKGTYKKNFLGNEQGFSLMELLIVMIIMGLLASLVGPKLFGKLGMAKVKTAKSQIALFMSALDSYRLDVGHYPKSLRELHENVGNAKGWDGPYIAKKVPKDPWGNEYVYKIPGSHGDFDIISYGADGSPGGTGKDADIGSWESN